MSQLHEVGPEVRHRVAQHLEERVEPFEQRLGGRVEEVQQQQTAAGAEDHAKDTAQEPPPELRNLPLKTKEVVNNRKGACGERPRGRVGRSQLAFSRYPNTTCTKCIYTGTPYSIL